ncbi:MAG: hypothetical protein J2P15_07780 [Micromonosporaceae bacterium]|nr:hypothetical protein [Micromonosporaceae bacterium]
MDHHEWQDWPEEHGDLGDGDTADLSGHDGSGSGELDGGLGHGGVPGEFEDYPTGHEAFDAGQPYLHPDPGPDLLHDSVGGDPGAGEPGHSDPSGWEPPGADGFPDTGGPDDLPPHDLTEPDHLAFGDPDLTADPDPGWHASDFPPPLDLGHPPPEPLDGYPWTDPDTLGSGHDDAAGPDHDSYADQAAPPEDLFAYSGMEQPAGRDPWSALLLSDDPATSSLARWWGAAA